MKHFSFQLLFTILVATHLAGQRAPSLVPDSLPKRLDLKLPKTISGARLIPTNNLLQTEVVELGRRIFFDPILSRDKTVSCASCHRPDSGFASKETVAIGIDGKMGTRNSPTLFNRGFGGRSFWDGRAATLEEQVLEPISNPLELGNSVDGVLKAIDGNASLKKHFSQVFISNKEVKNGKSVVTEANLARALASFVRSLVLGDSPVDEFHRGKSSALTTIEKRGLWLFESRGGCWQCHSGFNFTDEAFHNTGVAWESGNADLGRGGVTKKKRDLRAFKTPTLRGVDKTAPYMHNGSLKTLKDVVEFYNRGGGRADDGLDKKMRPLSLDNKDVDALVAFLKALSRNKVDTSRPRQKKLSTRKQE